MLSYKEIGLVNSKHLFEAAMKGGYAVPAFNFNNNSVMNTARTSTHFTREPLRSIR